MLVTVPDLTLTLGLVPIPQRSGGAQTGTEEPSQVPGLGLDTHEGLRRSADV